MYVVKVLKLFITFSSPFNGTGSQYKIILIKENIISDTKIIF